MEDKKMKITVKTPSRLHLGILDVNGNLGRMYGSIGLAIQQPNVVIEITKSENLEIEGEDKERVKETSEILGRGTVSGIGTAVFEFGGFVVDGGKSSNQTRKNMIPPIISRHE